MPAPAEDDPLRQLENWLAKAKTIIIRYEAPRAYTAYDGESRTLVIAVPRPAGVPIGDSTLAAALSCTAKSTESKTALTIVAALLIIVATLQPVLPAWSTLAAIALGLLGGFIPRLLLLRPRCRKTHVHSVPRVLVELASAASKIYNSCARSGECRGETSIAGVPARYRVGGLLGRRKTVSFQLEWPLGRSVARQIG